MHILMYNSVLNICYFYVFLLERGNYTTFEYFIINWYAYVSANMLNFLLVHQWHYVKQTPVK